MSLRVFVRGSLSEALSELGEGEFLVGFRHISTNVFKAKKSDVYNADIGIDKNSRIREILGLPSSFLVEEVIQKYKSRRVYDYLSDRVKSGIEDFEKWVGGYVGFSNVLWNVPSSGDIHEKKFARERIVKTILGGFGGGRSESWERYISDLVQEFLDKRKSAYSMDNVEVSIALGSAGNKGQVVSFRLNIGKDLDNLDYKDIFDVVGGVLVDKSSYMGERGPFVSLNVSLEIEMHDEVFIVPGGPNQDWVTVFRVAEVSSPNETRYVFSAPYPHSESDGSGATVLVSEPEEHVSGYWQVEVNPDAGGKEERVVKLLFIKRFDSSVIEKDSITINRLFRDGSRYFEVDESGEVKVGGGQVGYYRVKWDIELPYNSFSRTEENIGVRDAMVFFREAVNPKKVKEVSLFCCEVDDPEGFYKYLLRSISSYGKNKVDIDDVRRELVSKGKPSSLAIYRRVKNIMLLAARAMGKNKPLEARGEYLYDLSVDDKDHGFIEGAFKEYSKVEMLSMGIYPITLEFCHTESGLRTKIKVHDVKYLGGEDEESEDPALHLSRVLRAFAEKELFLYERRDLERFLGDDPTSPGAVVRESMRTFLDYEKAKSAMESGFKIVIPDYTGPRSLLLVINDEDSKSGHIKTEIYKLVPKFSQREISVLTGPVKVTYKSKAKLDNED